MKKFLKFLDFYFQKTTLHGFVYISASRTWTERIVWILALLLSLICCIFLVYELTVKVLTNPVVVQQPDFPVHVKDIPFPAFSLCPSNALQNPYDGFSSLLKNNTWTFRFGPYGLLFDHFIGWRLIENYYQNDLDFGGVWMDKYRIKTEYVISPLGWCYVFNIVEHEKMFHVNSTAEYFQVQQGNLSDSYQLPENLTADAPLSTISNKLGLSISYSVEENPKNPCTYYESKYNPPGTCNEDNNNHLFLVIHSSYERPDLRHKKLKIENFGKYGLTVTPSLKVTDDTLLGEDAEERNCYKENEKELKYFKYYTKINCLRECESSYVLQKCGCVPYHFINNDTALICTSHQMTSCFNLEYEKFNETICNCFPPCMDLSYDLRIKTRNLPDSIVINFSDDTFYPLIRRKYFTFINWFSFIGGLLGLFFGFSFLSTFEFIFHVWLNLTGSRKSFKRQEATMKTKNYARITNCLKNFMDNSSIHGLNYISDATLKLIDRIAFLICFILSITACAYMIIQLRQNLSIEKISLANTDKTFNITNMPFPALTCLYNLQMTQCHRFLTNGRRFQELSQDEKDLYMLCKATTHMIDPNKYSLSWSEENSWYRGYGSKIIPFIRNYSRVQEHNLPWMAWNEKLSAKVARILSSRGYSFSFNMIDVDKMFHIERVSSDFLYNQTFYRQGPVNRSFIEDPRYPAYSDKEKLFIANIFRNWAKIFLHSPYEYPFRIKNQFDKTVDFIYAKTVEVLIIPEIVTTNDELKSLSIKQRMCYKDGEKKLFYFKVYTQQNCQMECLSKKLLEACCCIPFDIVRGHDVKICELSDEKCIKKIEKELSSNLNGCDCLQPCDYITYSYEFHEWNHRSTSTIGISYDNYKDALEKTSVHLSIISIRFKEKEFSSMQRIRQFTFVDFLSQVGGLLGLFAGISVLSLFELFYFFTVRQICEIYTLLKERKRIGNQNIIHVAPYFETVN